MPVYGQAITKMHYGHRKLLEMLSPNETLELSSYLCLEVGRNHVFWDAVFVMLQSLDCFPNELSLICMWKGRDDLAHHSASAPEFGEVACGFVCHIARQDHITGDGGGLAIAYA